jgi:hypothetical protein
MMLVITGHQRSGTTMLRYLCHRHPALAVTHEAGLLLEVGRPYADYAHALWQYTRQVNGGWGFVFTRPSAWQNHLGNIMFTTAYLAALRWQGSDKVGYSEVEAGLRRIFRRKVLVGDKLPQYRNYLAELSAQEQVRLLIIYRDCRDVTSSYLEKKRTDWKGQPWAERMDSASKIARRWVQDVETMEKYAAQGYLVRYEQLITQPAQELSQLADWLGVPVQGFRAELLHDSSIGKYRDGLTAAELAEVVAVAGPTMARLGYDVE